MSHTINNTLLFYEYDDNGMLKTHEFYKTYDIYGLQYGAYLILKVYSEGPFSVLIDHTVIGMEDCEIPDLITLSIPEPLKITSIKQERFIDSNNEKNMEVGISLFKGYVISISEERDGIKKVAIFNYNTNSEEILTIWDGWTVDIKKGMQYLMRAQQNITGTTSYGDGNLHKSSAFVLKEAVCLEDESNTQTQRVAVL